MSAWLRPISVERVIENEMNDDYPLPSSGQASQELGSHNRIVRIPWMSGLVRLLF